MTKISATSLNWISSTGGPYILTNQFTALEWGGVESISKGSKQQYSNDYERACEIKNYCGIIFNQNKPILVIGDTPNDMAVLELKENGILLIKWVGAESEEQILASLHNIDNLTFDDQNLSFPIEDENLVVFDASATFKGSANNKLFVNGKRGNYGVGVLNFAPTDDLILQLIKLSFEK